MINPIVQFPVVNGPIVGAGTRNLTHTNTAPQARYTVQGWAQPMLMLINSVRVKEGDAVTISREFKTQGFLTPEKGQKLELKWEGERSWRHYNLFCVTDPNLQNNDQVIINSMPYRVMHKWQWQNFGYYKYKLVEDYTSATET